MNNSLFYDCISMVLYDGFAKYIGIGLRVQLHIANQIIEFR